jgi:nucleoside-diphosphate-sugar epimerase
MILVTGGTGMVGSHLLYHLLLKYDTVKAIHKKTSDLNAVKKVFGYYSDNFENIYNKIIWIEADLCDIPSLEHAFQDVTYVYHCAALVSLLPSDYHKMRTVNIDGSVNIVNLCISNSIKKLCFVSSVAVIEKNKKNQFNDESESWNNSIQKSGYAITKYGAEMEVWRASQEGIDVVIVNPGVILGSGFWQRGTGKMFSQVHKGLNFYTEGVNGFVGVKDVVQIMIQLMQSEIKNERFILVSENMSFKEVFFQIADALNKKRPNFEVTPFLSQIVWRLDIFKSFFTGKAPLLNRETAKTILSKEYYTSKKIQSSLNYKFERIDKTIKTTCNDFIKQ